MSHDDDPLDDDSESDDPASLQPTVDAGTRDGVRRQERKQDREHREAQEFWRGIFATPIGRREMWRLLDALHPFEDRFACGPNGFPQSEATWFHAGEQSTGLRMYHAWLLIARDGVLMMQDEHDPRFAVKPSRQRRKSD